MKAMSLAQRIAAAAVISGQYVDGLKSIL
jgi:hypothetical protein